MPDWRLVLGLLAAAAYALLSHGLMLYAADRPWAVAALLGPLLLAGLGFALKRRNLPAVALMLLAGAGLLVAVARGGIGPVSRLYVAQHVGIHLALCASFGLTLWRSPVSLIGQIAERVHGRLTPAMAAYTRRVTAVWTGYFLGMALLSLWVYARHSWDSWSLLANLITPLAIGGLFVGEYLLRYRLHPEFERSTLMSAVRAYSRPRTIP